MQAHTCLTGNNIHTVSADDQIQYGFSLNIINRLFYKALHLNCVQSLNVIVF